jgi:hypothetical protein
LARDPGEHINRIRDEPAVASALESRLDALLEELDRPTRAHRTAPMDAETEERLQALGYLP